MGAFLSGLLGAAGKDIEQQNQRAYDEKRQERQDRMRLLELAASNPNVKPDSIPLIFGELDELAQDAGYKSPSKVKNPFVQMGGMVKHILTRNQQQQQQKQQAQQAAAAVQGAPGVTAQPAQQLVRRDGVPPMPQSRIQPGWFNTQGDIDKREEQQFQTSEKRRLGQSQADFDQKLKEVDQLEKNGYSKQEAQQIVFGKAAAPAGQKFAPFYISGAQIPAEVQIDALGNPINRKDGTYKLEETTGKYYPVAAGPKAGAVDEVTKWAKVFMTQNPRMKPEEAAQKAADLLVKNKFILPEQRLQLIRDSVRTIQGETGILTVPTHVPGAMGRGATASPFPNVSTPPLPARPGNAPQSTSGGQPAQPGQPTAPARGVSEIPPTRFIPKIGGTERTRKDNAEVIMTRGGSLIATVGQIAQQHPEWTGLVGSKWQTLKKTVGAADPQIGQLQGALESLVGFLPSLHAFRSKSILDSWKETLDNPLKNPQLTQSVIREVMKAAEELRNTIVNPSVAPMTAEEEEKKAAGNVSRGTSGSDLSKVPTDELIKRLATPK